MIILIIHLDFLNLKLIKNENIPHNSYFDSKYIFLSLILKTSTNLMKGRSQLFPNNPLGK